ncbi:MAG TPA: tetratricopeptide repeat protein [Casimicrobiaceae bacterium]|nr:tetratricopeptide repeat protein [Casimicrobiaceae bacterium]
MSAQLLDPLSHVARIVRTVLVIDVVESVRLIEENESEAVARWRALAGRIEKEIVPSFSGHVVKSLGDGLMLEFEQVVAAIRAAFAIRSAAHDCNAGVLPERQMFLRMAAHVSPLLADDHDIYGHGVNVAARLTSLAGPDEIVVSADVRDQLTAGLDGDIEDLGECHLKHLRRPVRAYRVGPPGMTPMFPASPGGTPDLQPTLAVIPFNARTSEPEHGMLGEVLADEIISALSRTREMHVISRLSTTAFRGRDASLAEVSGHLKANYVLSGAYLVSGNSLSLSAELAESTSSHVVWARTLKGHVAGILEGKDELIDRVVAEASAAIIIHELQRAQTQPLPTLQTYTLLLAAVALLHRLSPQAFDHARRMLEAVIERVPRQAAPRAWLAKWHVMRVQQGWSPDARAEGQAALACTKRALELDPGCSLALTIDGLVNTNLLQRLDLAEQRYQSALHINPNDSLAWLLKGTLHAFKGEGKQAMSHTQRALRLSPLDPLRYYYDSLAATAALSSGQYERAIKLAESSLRANRTHTSTLRAIAIARWQLGDHEGARQTAAELLRLEPGLTITRWRERSPSRGYETGKLWGEVLRQVGVPE